MFAGLLLQRTERKRVMTELFCKTYRMPTRWEKPQKKKKCVVGFDNLKKSSLPLSLCFKGKAFLTVPNTQARGISSIMDKVSGPRELT